VHVICVWREAFASVWATLSNVFMNFISQKINTKRKTSSSTKNVLETADLRFAINLNIFVSSFSSIAIELICFCVSFSFETDPRIRHTAWSILIGHSFMFSGMYGTTQTVIQRFLCCKTEKQAKM